MMKSDLIDIEVEIIAETELAVRIDDGDTKVWLPKSQIEIERPRTGHKAPTIVTLSERLAQDKALI
jgi:hypothetical protein